MFRSSLHHPNFAHQQAIVNRNHLVKLGEDSTSNMNLHRGCKSCHKQTFIALLCFIYEISGSCFVQPLLISELILMEEDCYNKNRF